MKITKNKLRQIIKEELSRVLSERVHQIHTELSPVPGKSAPTFGSVELAFASEVDMGLYIVFNAKEKSRSEPQLLRWLSSLGYTQAEMYEQGEIVKKTIQNLMVSHPKWQGYSRQYVMKGVVIQVPPTAAPPAGPIG